MGHLETNFGRSRPQGKHYTDRVTSSITVLNPTANPKPILARTISLVGANFIAFLRTAAPLSLPVALFTATNAIVSFPMLVNQLGSASRLRVAPGGLAGLFVTLCAGILVLALGMLWPWMDAALTYEAMERAEGRKTTTRIAWRNVRPMAISLWAAHALRVAAMALGWVLALAPLLLLLMVGQRAPVGALFIVGVCLVPLGIAGWALLLFIGLRWSLLYPAVVAEARSGFSGLERSNALTRRATLTMLGRSLQLLAVLALLNALPSVLMASGTLGAVGASQATDAAGQSLPFVILHALGAILQALVFWIERPLVTTFFTLCYLDLRKRGAAPPPPAAASLSPYGAPALGQLRSAPMPPPAAPVPAISYTRPIEKTFSHAPPNAAPGVQEAPRFDAPAGLTAEWGSNVGPSASNSQRISAAYDRLNREGERPDVLMVLGQAYLDAGNPEAATDAFGRARALAPSDPAPILMLCRAHLAGGEVPRAREALRAYLALETDPDHRAAVLTDPLFSVLR